jgi:hypothetical protein
LRSREVERASRFAHASAVEKFDSKAQYITIGEPSFYSALHINFLFDLTNLEFPAAQAVLRDAADDTTASHVPILITLRITL